MTLILKSCSNAMGYMVIVGKLLSMSRLLAAVGQPALNLVSRWTGPLGPIELPAESKPGAAVSSIIIIFSFCAGVVRKRVIVYC
jgi:hypothetical protein